LKFFVDNNLSRQLANGMKAFGEDVIHITEIFPDNADDTEYLPRVGSEGWILVTRDNRIRYRPAEQTAPREHQVGAFFMGGKNLNRCQLIQQLVRNWPRMKELAHKTPVPFAFQVPPSGTKLRPLPLN
jgi:predicted nuclease of predicted toxin-antitoxin system